MWAMDFRTWVGAQRRGTLARIRRETGLGWSTLWRAQQGHSVSYRTARALSLATGGVVSIVSLCEAHEVEAA